MTLFIESLFRIAVCGALMLVFGCPSDSGSLDAQLTARLRACDLLGPGIVREREDATDPDDRCFARCIIRGSCAEIEAALCGDDLLEDRCDEECYGIVAGDFICGDGTTVPASWQCDGDDDCADASDEAGCATFACADGTTIPVVLQCDFDDDCADGSDEAGCTNGFQCGDGGRIPDDYQCDGDMDCEDGSDEAGCPTFRCGDGSEVPVAYQCDGTADCSDESDESGCPAFACADGSTVPVNYQCDGDDDCPDASDEAGCAEFTLSCMP